MDFFDLPAHFIHSDRFIDYRTNTQLRLSGKIAEEIEVSLFQVKMFGYLIGSEGERCITLLSDVPEDISVDLPYLQYFFGPRKLIRLTLPSTMRKQLPLLKQHKFYFWDEDGEEALNILLFSLPAL
jgi:hypothetical protein